MITNADVTKLKEVFATKEELAEVKIELGELHDKFDVLDEKFDHMLTVLDGVADSINTSKQEEAAGSLVLARHTRQIEALAAHTGALLPD